MISRRIAVIGSFRQHYVQVREACFVAQSAGHVLTSPLGQEILEPHIQFVRFETDDKTWSDSAIQSLALHRIFNAEVVYVVCPGGYIGKTTCYELGRLVQARKPVYFSEHPNDLPILVPGQFVVSASKLVADMNDDGWFASWLFHDERELTGVLERELADGQMRNA